MSKTVNNVQIQIMKAKLSEQGVDYAHIYMRAESVLMAGCLAMQEYAEQQVKQERERHKKLEESVSHLLHLHSCEQEGIQSGRPTAKEWFDAVNNVSELLNQSPK